MFHPDPSLGDLVRTVADMAIASVLAIVQLVIDALS